MTQRAPDLVDALIGYRAWRLDPDGALRPWTLSAAGAWTPGTNTATCHLHDFDPSRRKRGHRPPAAGCMCGLYALAALDDRRLRQSPEQAVGAIAAWGEIEVHRTGFRAEHAAVVALALPPAGHAPPPGLPAAGARYGVPVVPREELAAAAARHGAPLGPELFAGHEAEDERRAARHADEVGFALDEHLWVRPTDALVEVGLTDAFWAMLGDDVELTLPATGMEVAPGDVLGLAEAGGRSYVIWSCLSGTVVETAHDATTTRGWAVRIADTAWAEDAGSFLWGRAGATNYDAHVASARHGVDVWAGLLGERLFSAPVVRSGQDVLQELARRRAAPRFASAADVYAACAPPLHERVARDPAAAARAARADVTVGYLAHDPDAAFTLTARDGRVSLRCGAAAPDADLVLTSTAEVAEAFFTGSLDLPQALRNGQLGCAAGRARALPVLSVLKAVL